MTSAVLKNYSLSRTRSSKDWLRTGNRCRNCPMTQKTKMMETPMTVPVTIQAVWSVLKRLQKPDTEGAYSRTSRAVTQENKSASERSASL
jgi:hypothetical protein